MTERIHRDFEAYSIAVPSLKEARLFSLKLEFVELPSHRRRYVDAILMSGKRLIQVPFIFIAEDGSAVLSERHQVLSLGVQEWLAKTAAEWANSKGADANLVADLFDNDEPLRAQVLGAMEGAGRPLCGLSPYPQLFDEGERYANLTPFVLGRSVIDFNPGFTYGLRTLAAAAQKIAVSASTLTDLTRRIQPDVAVAEKSADIAVFLDVAPEKISGTLEGLRSAVRPGGRMIVSARGDEGADVLRSAGADVFKMARPGCEVLGLLDEWLGVVAQKPAVFDVPVDIAEPPSESVTVAATPLRVLFALRPSAEHLFGGDVVQVRETAQALRDRGHFVEISTAERLDAAGFDVVHLTNITVPPETLPQAQSVSNFDGPLVMMPIFTDHCDETVWGMSITTSVYASHQDLAQLYGNLRLIEDRRLGSGRLQPPPQRTEMAEGYTPMQKAILESVDFLIANAHSEMHRLYRYLACDVPYAVAPSCANPLVYGAHARSRFVQRYGLEDFILLAGRYEGRKNQLNFFEVTRALGLPVLYIGGNNYNAAFGSILRMQRPGNAAFIAHLAEADLAGAFAAARVVAIPSWDEVVTLTSLNAAISGASMVLSRNSYEHEYFADDAEYCDPGSISSIASAVKRAWDTHEARTERRGQLVERVKRDFNWKRSAALTEEAYYRVLQYNPRRDRRLRESVQK